MEDTNQKTPDANPSVTQEINTSMRVIKLKTMDGQTVEL